MGGGVVSSAPGGGFPGQLRGSGNRVVTRFSGPTASFDKAKVDTLRQAIVGTLVKYGHRMDKVAESERLIVIVEAPSATQASPVSVAIGGFGGGAVGPMGGGIAVKGPDVPVDPEKPSAAPARDPNGPVTSETIVEAPGMPGMMGPSLAFSVFNIAVSNDRLMLALPKSSLTVAVTNDAVAGQVEERRY